MKANHFGQMLIIFGVFVALAMFFLADWRDDFGFMHNIRYAYLVCTDRLLYQGLTYACSDEAIDIRLGEGLIIPLVFISIGLMIVRNIISENLLGKIMPFIKKTETANQ